MLWPIPVHVRRNIKLAEAPSYGKTIFEYEPKCHGAADYKTVAEYIHSQTGAEPEGDISKQPPIGIQELGPVKKAAATEDTEIFQTRINTDFWVYRRGRRRLCSRLAHNQQIPLDRLIGILPAL